MVWLGPAVPGATLEAAQQPNDAPPVALDRYATVDHPPALQLKTDVALHPPTFHCG